MTTTDPIVRPVRVAVVNDYDLIVHGLAQLITPFEEQIELVDAIVIGEPLGGPVDVALYDTYGRVGIGKPALAELSAMPSVGRVALFAFDITPAEIVAAQELGVSGFISKRLTGPDIADAIVRVAQGEQFTAGMDITTGHSAPWPGHELGLSELQSQILALLAAGMTNREIADAMNFSPETIKSYLRPIFRALGVRNRGEASAWVHRSESFRRRL